MNGLVAIAFAAGQPAAKLDRAIQDQAKLPSFDVLGEWLEAHQLTEEVAGAVLTVHLLLSVPTAASVLWLSLLSRIVVLGPLRYGEIPTLDIDRAAPRGSVVPACC